MKHGKGYRKAAEQIDTDKLYEPNDAIKIAKDTSPSKFDATVEVAMRLGVDPRKADQMVRGTVNLPHGTGKTARVIVFAQGAKAEEAAKESPPHAQPALKTISDTARDGQTKLKAILGAQS